MGVMSQVNGGFLLGRGLTPPPPRHSLAAAAAAALFDLEATDATVLPPEPRCCCLPAAGRLHTGSCVLCALLPHPPHACRYRHIEAWREQPLLEFQLWQTPLG
jgi:hypothetical protein